jgi:drug/metabolite transporter (DMT)-like permease
MCFDRIVWACDHDRRPSCRPSIRGSCLRHRRGGLPDHYIASDAPYLFGVDAWSITWYSGIATTLAFIVGSLAAGSLNMPQTAVGWIGLFVVSLGTTAGTFLLFVSVIRIGPFRSALIMQLEPLTATILGAVLIGEVITLIQGAGGIIMLGALTAFQLGQRKPQQPG